MARRSATRRRCRRIVSISPAARIRCAASAKAASVRRTIFGRPYGGNIKTVAQTELLLPMPEKWRNSARFSLFFDIGNVFSDQDIGFFGAADRTEPDRRWTTASVMMNSRQSAGVAVQWLAPLGVFRFSYAVPLNESQRRYGDRATATRPRASSSRSARRSDWAVG